MAQKERDLKRDFLSTGNQRVINTLKIAGVVFSMCICGDGLSN